MDYSNKRVLVVGMARSGIAAANLLYKLNTKEIILNDRRHREAFNGKLDELFRLGMTDRLGMEPDELIHDVDLVVFSSGVPFWKEWILNARSKGIPCVNELELAYWVTTADFVAITGTNGKTTTTTLTAEIFKAWGKVSHPVGNIGDPACTYAYEMKKGDIAVAEVAPFQMVSTIDFHPRVSAILNITEDHLDWFKTMDNYIDGKCLVFQNQTEDDYCVLNYDNEITATLGDRPKAKVMFFSIKHELTEGAYVKDGNIILSTHGNTRVLMKAEDVRIPGNHNLENALAAALVTSLMGTDDATIAHTLKTFSGVEHRIETVATVNGVTYINDSKGTNPDATIMAIRAMKAPTVLILGGYDKHGDFTPMFREFTENIRHIVVLGETKRQIVDTAKAMGFTAITEVDTFEEAVSTCAQLAEEGMNVLLSPACASWDMFSDFEQRGRRFKELVMELK
ncbi:MAG: UDP-N-acetylmuramoyl-L-alanine--D-glutamate ligase [Clostridiales bacterium]|nr:UDP-N-acetylmuramoyl-L-alanine--D-glutamate ligase [Clostridiales bacterium]